MANNLEAEAIENLGSIVVPFDQSDNQVIAKDDTQHSTFFLYIHC